MSSTSKPPRSRKVLLALMPFWDPFIPPLGISCLHGFLARQGIPVKKVDANIEKAFTDIYDRYFDTLKQNIPGDRRSNFYNIGKDVLRNHMMAHIYHTDQTGYQRLVKTLVLKTFFCDIADKEVKQLIHLLEIFYSGLESYLLGLVEKEKPDIVGLSVFKGSLPASLFAFKTVKENYPHIRTVMGGGIYADQLAPGSPDWDLFLEKTPFIDAFLIGEGELLFLKYLQDELPGNKKIFTLEDINGETLDISSGDVDIPDFSGFDLQYYPALAAYTSRSCPFLCKFCSETVRWGKYRKKSAQQVTAELTQLYEKHGYQSFLLSDSLLNPIITELANELYHSQVSFYWDGYLRVDQEVCDEQKTLGWRRGGFYRARLGVESGSQRVLDLMNKKITPRQIKAAIKNLAHAGIKTTTYWIIGYPGETEEDFQQTMKLVEELKNDIYEAEFNAFWYYASGQVNSDKWAGKSVFLYPETAVDMLVLPTRILDLYPGREETYRRLKRIYEHSCNLGIPNPYSLYDIFKADERWEKLHKNAVPSLLKFKEKGEPINECKFVKEFFSAQETQTLEGDWNF